MSSLSKNMHYTYALIFSIFLFIGHGDSSTDQSLWKRLPEDCGKTIFDNITERIIDGDEAKPGQFPWLARLGIRVGKEKSIMYCGGSLINRYYVVSAAHCREVAQFVRLGETHSASTNCTGTDCPPLPQDIDIARFIFADFCRVSLHNDIYMIELKQPAVFNELVRPVCLPRVTLPYSDLINKAVTIAGWGVTNAANKTKANNLMYIWNPIIEMKECTTAFRTTVHLDSQLCIGERNLELGNSSCFGDSGGPATMRLDLNGEKRAHLIGIVSYGLRMCEKGPAIYTYVSSFTDWILEKIDKM